MTDDMTDDMPEPTTMWMTRPRKPAATAFVPCRVRRGYTTFVVAAVHRSPRWPDLDGPEDVDQQPWHVCEIYGTVRADHGGLAADAVLADDVLRENIARGLNSVVGYTYNGKPCDRGTNGERIFAVFALEDMLWVGARLNANAPVNTRIGPDGKTYRYVVRY
jgi:hypothetical protein